MWQLHRITDKLFEAPDEVELIIKERNGSTRKF